MAASITHGSVALAARLVAALTLSLTMPAQDNADALAARVDSEVLSARSCSARARAIRRDIVQEWSPGDQKALVALGFVKIGDVFKRDLRSVVFTRDLTADKKALRRADRDWQRVEKQLARRLEQVAKAYAAVDDRDRATVYWRRLLRLRPGYSRALRQMQLLGFDGHEGTEYELHLLRRGRAIAQVSKYLQRAKFVTTELSGQEHPLLAAVGLGHHGLRSDHFKVWGTLPLAELRIVAEYAERSLLLARMLFGVSRGFVFRPAELRDIVWVGDRASYQQVLDGCAGQFSPDRLQFLKNDVELAYVASGRDSLRLYVLDETGREVMLDQTVRGVMQDATRFASHGLWEGIGHAACGFLFDQTLSFFIEQQVGRTVTKIASRPLMPDMAVWREIAAESAWGRSDTPVSRLVLLHGAKFTNAERVKAWAMADYLLRDRPELLFRIDASRSGSGTGPPGVEAAFQQATGLEMPALDARWRHYWGAHGELRQAMRAEPAGDSKDVEGARAIADALNDARIAANIGPIGFYVASGDGIEAVRRHFAALSRAEKEQRKDPEKQVAMPVPPAELGRSLLAFRGNDPAAAVARWLLDPVARDALLHPGRILIGCNRGQRLCVLDLSEPAAPTTGGLPVTWPRSGQQIAGRARVRDLGPVLVDALAADGKQSDTEVGVPLSLHFARKLTADELAAVSCRVLARGRELAGVQVDIQDVPGRDGPGCIVFVPLQPLPSGAAVEVEWTVPRQLLAEGEQFPALVCTIR